MVKILALFLPQFHETEENNIWWGKGFTEWTNTKKAKKLFCGHNQPRVPLNDNYYDLSNIEVLKSQSQMAKQYGIDGFCYYHYWFKGKQMLHLPLLNMLERPDIEMPFCLSWANDSWNKGWDGNDKEILIKQDYGDPSDWQKHLDYLIPFFKDKRYLKVNNKPLFFIYRAIGFDKMNQMIDFWNQALTKEGFDGIHFVETLNSFQQECSCSNSEGVFTFEPMLSLRLKISLINKIKGKLNNSFGLKLLLKDNYERVWNQLFNTLSLKKYSNKKSYAGAFVDWDNTPRKGKSGLVIKGATPKKFGIFFSRLLQIAKNENTEFVIINAWNEWAEGCYLEPDKKYKYEYLNQVLIAKKSINKNK